MKKVKRLLLLIALFIFSIAANAQTEYKIESFKTPLVAKKMLFDWFGKWDKVLYTEDNQILLVWKNRNVINEAPESFTLIASSFEDGEEMYGIVQVLTASQHDALAKDSPYREYINEFLKTLSKKEVKNRRFYKEYIKLEY